MLKILTTATTIIMLGLAATGVAQARGGHFGGHHGSGIIRGYQPQQSVAPQFNNPGPQMSIPQTGNAVDQLSPLMGAGQPDPLGIK
jgi:hypothetical protein